MRHLGFHASRGPGIKCIGFSLACRPDAHRPCWKEDVSNNVTGTASNPASEVTGYRSDDGAKWTPSPTRRRRQLPVASHGRVCSLSSGLYPRKICVSSRLHMNSPPVVITITSSLRHRKRRPAIAGAPPPRRSHGTTRTQVEPRSSNSDLLDILDGDVVRRLEAELGRAWALQSHY